VVGLCFELRKLGVESEFIATNLYYQLTYVSQRKGWDWESPGSGPDVLGPDTQRADGLGGHGEGAAGRWRL
jgi:hypothetical protein